MGTHTRTRIHKGIGREYEGDTKGIGSGLPNERPRTSQRAPEPLGGSLPPPQTYPRIPVVFPSYSLHIPFMSPWYSPRIPFVFFSYSLRIPFLFLAYSLRISVVFPSYSLRIPFVFLFYSLH